MKYLYNPATDEFESLAPTLKDRFNLKDQVADASAAVQGTEEAIDLSVDAFKAYQNAGGTKSYKDFIKFGNEGVSKFFKDGGRVDFELGGGVIQGERVGNRENFAAPFAIPVIAPGMVTSIASLLGVAATGQAITTYLQKNPSAIDTVKKALEMSGKMTGILPFGTKPGEQPEIEEELKELSKSKGFDKAPERLKEKGTTIPEKIKTDQPLKTPPKTEPLPGFQINEEASKPQILNFEGTRGKIFEDLPQDIELKPIKSGEVFVKTGGTKERAAPLTGDGEALLENFEKVIEYYNANNIPTPGLKDIFDIAGGNDIKKFREEKGGKKITVPVYNNLVSSTGS